MSASRSPWDTIEREFGVRETDDGTLRSWLRMCLSARRYWETKDQRSAHFEHYNDLCNDLETVLRDRAAAEDMAE